VNSLPKTVTHQRHGCDLNSGPTVPESSTLTTQLPSAIGDFGDVFLQPISWLSAQKKLNPTKLTRKNQSDLN